MSKLFDFFYFGVSTLFLFNQVFELLILVQSSNVLKTGPDRPVRPVIASTGHKTGPVQCKKTVFYRTGEPAVELVNRQSNRWSNRPVPINFFFFLKLKRCRFDVFYIETMSFYLELESL